MKFIALALSLLSFAAFANKTTKTTTTTTSTMAPTQLDDLIRGEMAAVKAYDQALADLKDEKDRAPLMKIRNQHDMAVTKLVKYAENRPDIKEDVVTAGPWGTFAKAWVKGGSLMSNKAALTALKQGEEHGVDEYKEALEDDTINAQLKQEIRANLLPAQQKHIETLKAIR